MEVIKIKNRWNGKVLYSGEHADIKEAVEAAVKAGADLRGADLCGADLCGANLCDADLCGAGLRDADLCGADLCDADLCGADLCDANLCGANLRDADLCDANLCGTDLRGADLCGADLCGANLCGAQVGKGGDEATLVGSRPVVQIGQIGSRNDWLLVFWCGDAGVRISAGCQKQISEAHFLKRLAYRHGEGEQASIHAQHYIEALAFAKRLLKDQAEGEL